MGKRPAEAYCPRWLRQSLRQRRWNASKTQAFDRTAETWIMVATLFTPSFNFNVGHLSCPFSEEPMLEKPAASTVVEVICQGSPKDMGLAQGGGAKNKVQGALHALPHLGREFLESPA